MRISYKIPHLIVVLRRVAFRLGSQLRDRAHNHARLDEARSIAEKTILLSLDAANLAIAFLLLLLDRVHWAIGWIFKNRTRAGSASITGTAIKVDLNPLTVLSTDPIEFLSVVLNRPYPIEPTPRAFPQSLPHFIASRARIRGV